MSSPAMRRVIAVAACGLFLLVAVILLLADRSSSLVGTAQHEVVAAGQAIERTYDIDVIDRGDIPGTSDQIGHAALWGSGMLLAGWLGRRRLPVPIAAVGMLALSLAFELSQPALSSTRQFQRSDMVGNVAGILGAAVALAVLLRLHRFTFRQNSVAAPTHETLSQSRTP